MNAMEFEPESFDLIWAEGALYQMGFENGLKKCRELLRKKGSIAVTELVWLKDDPPPGAKEWAQDYKAIKNIPDNIKLIKKCGYELLGHFTLPARSWFDHFYNPMQLRINELRPVYKDNQTALNVLDAAQK